MAGCVWCGSSAVSSERPAAIGAAGQGASVETVPGAEASRAAEDAGGVSPLILTHQGSRQKQKSNQVRPAGLADSAPDPSLVRGNSGGVGGARPGGLGTMLRRGTSHLLSNISNLGRQKDRGPPGLMRSPTFVAISAKSAAQRQERNIKEGLSDTLSRELIVLFEKLDSTGDGVLSKSEAMTYLVTLDESFGALSKSAQHERLVEFISSFPGPEHTDITLAMWKNKAKDNFALNESNYDAEEWKAMQQDAIEYTRKLIITFERRKHLA
jgi:hypothetical protein